MAAGVGLGALLARIAEAVIEGELTVDLGIGRRVQPLGPLSWEIAARRELVFDVIESPYRRTPQAMQDKLRVWERSGDMVLAEHLTKVRHRTVTTVETVRFERPGLIHFRLVRGPVPHLSEVFELDETEGGTRLTWRGELGTDLGRLGERWGARVARAWARAVERSIESVKTEAERRAR